MGPKSSRGTATPWGTPPELVALLYLVWSPPEASRVPFGPEKINLKIYSVWTSFDIDFLKSQKQVENKNWHWALG